MIALSRVSPRTKADIEPSSDWCWVVPADSGETRPRRQPENPLPPRYLHHDLFDAADAEARFAGPTPARGSVAGVGYMTDEITRDTAARMHYAAFRWHRAADGEEARIWRVRYIEHRNAVAEGNRKLAHRAVGTYHVSPEMADDVAGEFLLVLVHAVSCYNPWLGTRFSTYVFLCFKRTLARLAQRRRLSACNGLVLEDFPDFRAPADSGRAMEQCRCFVNEALAEDSSLLSPRERTVLLRRFPRALGAQPESLARMSDDLGISKEGIRQIQMRAVRKLHDEFLRNVPEV